MTYRALFLAFVLAACSSSDPASPDAAAGLPDAAAVQPDAAAVQPDAAGLQLDPCTQGCINASPAGEALFIGWGTCLEDTCQDTAPGSEENDACISAAFDPGDEQAPCRSQTTDCFSGPVAGCKEMMEAMETDCEPATLPIADEETYNEVIFCLIQHGQRTTRAVQLKSWPLFLCVFPMDGGSGCIEECMGGRVPCRACAAAKCGTLYDACLADSAPTVGDVPADKAACQEIFACTASCG